MNITTTTIKHKRYSYKGWTDTTETGELKNTLSQGEIGVLLTDDLSNVKEVRLGVKNNSSFFDGLMLGSIAVSDDISVKQFWDNSQRPVTGNEHTLYINKTMGIAYRWDDTTMSYHVISASPDGSGWWHEINGGKAYLNRDELGTSAQITWG